MKASVNLLLRFAVTYITKEGTEATWDYYASLYPSGTLRVFDPNWKAEQCQKQHYFQSKVTTSITNKNNLYIDPYLVYCAFINIAERQPFFPFEEIHFGYKDPYVPKVTMSIKMDPGVYDTRIIQFKGNPKENWISCDTATKHIFCGVDGVKRSMRDEID